MSYELRAFLTRDQATVPVLRSCLKVTSELPERPFRESGGVGNGNDVYTFRWYSK